MARHIGSGSLIQISFRSFQFLFAIISAALYGADLAAWTETQSSADSRWINAEVVAALAVFSCVLQWWLALHPATSSIWDSVICLLWLVTVAVLGQVAFRSEHVTGGYSSERLRAAVVISIFNMLLWLASAVEACICCGTKRTKRQEKRVAAEQGGSSETQEVANPISLPPAYNDLFDVGSRSPVEVSILDEKKAWKERETGMKVLTKLASSQER
ncbi:Fc.00g014300.m01.CDS01 [Cosmosporella sp. VM-42]